MLQNDKSIRFDSFVGVTQDSDEVLGKLLYFTLSSILVEKKKLKELCDAVGFPYNVSNRTAHADAFRSATGDIGNRSVIQDWMGPQIIKVYCRDNKGPEGLICRELVKETVHEDTNEYKKLANITLTKEGGIFSFDNLVSDPHVDALTYCLEAQRLFELYQDCAGRRQIETLLENYVNSMQAVKVARGRIYFVPRDFMEKVALFQDFVALLEQNNQHSRKNRPPLDANSVFVADEATQRDKMTTAFYRAIREEIETYEDRATHLIQSGNQSPAILERCVLRIRGLEEKKSRYEEILKRELKDTDDQFTSLRYLCDELMIRANGIRNSKKAA